MFVRLFDKKNRKRTFRSFKKNGKERAVLFKRTEKNAKNGTFFLKERKRTQRTERSFEKKGCPTLVLANEPELDPDPDPE